MNKDMNTIASLAAELGAQPYEIAAFGDLGPMAYDVPLNPDDEDMIREAWASAPDSGIIDAVTENAAEDELMAAVADILYTEGDRYDQDWTI